ncbi:M23 family metallopeptidase [Baia soyae]|uniref:LasA protease n=1 Tax=Baia soyae TaxID=1544746 RepID=A0A4R2S3G4_9BACL|nr:M23 family metallopeptidase [Baia soyae]TCP70484.1 LasA protease [Baia soyae]
MKKKWMCWCLGIALLLVLMPTVAVPVWENVTTSKISEDDISKLTEAVMKEMTQQKGASIMSAADVKSRAQVNVQRRDPDKKWVFGTAVIEAPKEKGAYPEGWIYVAKMEGAEWKVALEGSKSFQSWLQDAPSTIVNSNEKKVFANQSSDVKVMADQDQLRLPFALGATWTLTGGPHGYSGQNTPYSSLDLAGGNQQVLAAGSGNAYTMCGNGQGWVRIIHANGFSTDYYHLWNNIRPNGSWVDAGTFLGYTGTDVSCGGYASGRHVHFALRYNNAYVSINGREMGGWVFWSGNSAYEGYAMHGSTVRYPGQGLYNYGALAPNQGIVDVMGSGTLNVRSGPGSSYPIVGTKNDGEIVTIACTATGTTYTGRSKTTNIWDRIGNGQWVSDAYVWTGSSSAVAPTCN